MVLVDILGGQARSGPGLSSLSGSPRAAPLDEQRCYRAVCSRDRRFDGCFYTGVLTTGIYCRPSCPARTPKPANVRFFRTAAAAHGAGFRACKRCRPDAVPGSPEWSTRNDVVARAMRLIVDGELDRSDVGALAARLGYSERQLHRLLVAELGTGAVALARARRAETARVLLETTSLDVTGVAFASGFASVRQFNDTLREVFAMTPTEMRRAAKGRPAGVAPGAAGGVRGANTKGVRGASADMVAGADTGHGEDAGTGHHGDAVGNIGRGEDGKLRGDRMVSAHSGRKVRGIGARVGVGTGEGASAGAGPVPLVLRLPYREPFAAAELFGFLARRAVPGIESGTDCTYARSLALPHGPATVRLEAAAGYVSCTLRLTDLSDLAAAVARVRRLLDLDADPVAIDDVLGADPVLGPLVRPRPGLRSPGHVDPAELAVRAVVGQQVSVAAARGVTARLVQSFGTELPPALVASDDRLTHLFPSPERLAEVDPESGGLGMPRARAEAVVGLARALADGRLVLDAGADPERATADLVALDGIGPWTAGYIRMRALGDPDVFLPEDLVVRRTLAELVAPQASGRLVFAASDRVPLADRAGSPRSPAPKAKSRGSFVRATNADSSRWRPWRSYALHHLWSSLATEGRRPAGGRRPGDERPVRPGHRTKSKEDNHEECR